MKLKKIYFEAFRSLLNKELDVTFDCLGFVGTNESGKSNILTAINVLSGNRVLQPNDAPKMDKTNGPSLKFQFKLDEQESKAFTELISDWRKNNTLIHNIITTDLDIYYHIVYDKEKKEEIRYFRVHGIKLDKDSLILSYDKLNDSYKIKHGDEFLSLDRAIIIKPTNAQVDDKHKENHKEIDRLLGLISSHETEINVLKEKVQSFEFTVPETKIGEDGTITIIQDKKQVEEEGIKEDLIKKEKSLSELILKKNELETKVNGYNLKQIISEYDQSILQIDNEISKINSDLQTHTERKSELMKISELSEEQKNELVAIDVQITVYQLKIEEFKKEQIQYKNKIAELNQPIREKYTNNLSELLKHIDSLFQNYLSSILPKVVFWEYSPNYILKSETLYSDLLAKNNLNDISRPLVNILRIGLNIKTFSDLKDLIDTIRNEGSERSRLNKTINKKVNEYIKNAWKDYDQSIHISLEQERIRVEIFDPKREEDASHYNMEERSQGCQTFLSFLLTIGAEANQGVLKNNILLLDEPETHLHPSGVRFMLQELIKISERGNIVLYATHSIYLIDRNKFDRHIIVKKEKENTIFQPSNVGRVGYFMQEEVLYRTLDTRLDSDFSFANTFNFVFEGDGDVNLFECFYDKTYSKDEERPFSIKSTSFHQGGKCSDIRKFFNHRPIQLGTKWVFILDKDSPADDLKKFLESRYKNYINKDIFIFQYSNPNKNINDLEFEDLLPIPFILSCYIEAGKSLNISILEKDIAKHVTPETLYKKYDEIILKNYVSDDKKEEFGITFKKTLNNKIRTQTQAIKNIDTFKSQFPEYLDWVQEISKKTTELLESELSNK